MLLALAMPDPNKLKVWHLKISKNLSADLFYLTADILMLQCVIMLHVYLVLALEIYTSYVYYTFFICGAQ